MNTGGIASLSWAIHPHLACVWRAWDWVTGRRSSDLALVLWVAAYGGGCGVRLIAGRWVSVLIFIIGTACVLHSVLVLRWNPRSGGVVPVAVYRESRFLMTYASVLTVLSPLNALLSGFDWYLIESALLVLSCHAAVADTPGSGRTCAARAWDAVRALSLRPIGLTPNLGRI